MTPSLNQGLCLTSGYGLYSFSLPILLDISAKVIPIGSWEPLAFLALGLPVGYPQFPSAIGTDLR